MFGIKTKKLYQRALIQMEEAQSKLKAMGYSKSPSCDTKAYYSMLVNQDQILCSNRYTWTNLPINLTSQQLEAMFYKFGSICFFEDNGNLIISRYTSKGSLNVYGQLDYIQPIDLKGKSYGGKRRVITRNGEKVNEGESVAVIINDYTSFMDEEVTPRSKINYNSTIKDQVNVYMQLDNNIALSVKKALAMCENEDQRNTVLSQAQAILDPSSPVIAISTSSKKDGKASLPVEMFNFNNNFDTQNYCQQIDFYYKVRRSFDGVPAPDTFEKKERKVVGETEDTTTHTNMVLDDGLKTRQYGLELIKKYLHIEGIESVTVDINDILKEKEEAINDYHDNDNQDESDIQDD